ncbi:MAG: dTMP kinase [Holosporales bacterium]|nr:dTMP kinase [Holosporales bacterium]
MSEGLFITFEGGEGTGKSLQAKLLHEYLVESGEDAVLTREPGGTPVAEEIRKILVTGTPEKIGPLTESLLYLASRADHWMKKIKPLLDIGTVVVCDRFQDSSIVYQGVGKNVNTLLLNAIYNDFASGRQPDRTYLLDLDVDIGIARSLRNGQNTEARYEKMELIYHEKVRQGFLELARANPQRFYILDGMLSEHDIHKLVVADLRKFLQTLTNY